MAHSCSANARLCAGLTSPISPLSPLTPKYGSFISRDNSLTGINEFASSLGTSYIDSVLIDCYTGQPSPQPLDQDTAARPLPPGDTPPLQGSQPGTGSQSGAVAQAGALTVAVALTVAGTVALAGAGSQAGAGAQAGEAQMEAGSHRGSSAGILKRPQSLALVEEPMVIQSEGLENGRRRTVTFSQQVSLEFNSSD